LRSNNPEIDHALSRLDGNGHFLDRDLYLCDSTQMEKWQADEDLRITATGPNNKFHE
jgi:hypothetical protein